MKTAQYGEAAATLRVLGNEFGALWEYSQNGGAPSPTNPLDLMERILVIAEAIKKLMLQHGEDLIAADTTNRKSKANGECTGSAIMHYVLWLIADRGQRRESLEDILSCRLSMSDIRKTLGRVQSVEKFVQELERQNRTKTQLQESAQPAPRIADPAAKRTLPNSSQSTAIVAPTDARKASPTTVIPSNTLVPSITGRQPWTNSVLPKLQESSPALTKMNVGNSLSSNAEQRRLPVLRASGKSRHRRL